MWTTWLVTQSRVFECSEMANVVPTDFSLYYKPSGARNYIGLK